MVLIRGSFYGDEPGRSLRARDRVPDGSLPQIRMAGEPPAKRIPPRQLPIRTLESLATPDLGHVETRVYEQAHDDVKTLTSRTHTDDP